METISCTTWNIGFNDRTSNDKLAVLCIHVLKTIHERMDIVISIDKS